MIWVFGLAWPACCAGTMAETGKRPMDKREMSHGGIYRAPLLNNPSTLDPPFVKDMYGVAVVQQLFDGLVQFSPELYVIPALAESWQVEDGGKTYRFALRNDARFHNGYRVTSEDVLFSLSRLLRLEPPPAILPHLLKIAGARDYMDRKTEGVAGLTAVGEHTVVVRLEETHVPFIVALGTYQAKIVPRQAVEKDPQGFGYKPVGSGPFKFVSWEENKSIRLQGFQEYHGGRPLLDGIELVIYPGIGVEGVWADFQRGELDQMAVYGDIREKLKGRTDLQWAHRPSLNLQFYGFNCEHPLLKDPNLRVALSKALDTGRLVAEAYNGREGIAKGILPPGLPGYHPRDPGVGEDLPGALERMKQARGGANVSYPIEIVSNSQSPLARAELEFVRESWARLGIDLKVKFIPDWSQFEQYLKSDSLQVYRYVWFADIPDADDILRPLFSTDSQFNFTRYRNAKVDEMLHKALGIVDPVERAGLYRQIEEGILDSGPIIPLAHLITDFVYQPNVQGIEVSALGAHTMSFHRVWLKSPVRR